MDELDSVPGEHVIACPYGCGSISRTPSEHPNPHYIVSSAPTPKRIAASRSGHPAGRGWPSPGRAPTRRRTARSTCGLRESAQNKKTKCGVRCSGPSDPPLTCCFSPTAESFGVSALGSGVVWGGKVPRGFHQGSSRVPRGEVLVGGWGAVGDIA